ncbi:S10 family peptidase [Nesterenkonia alba]|uniref:S10 family peptidase n=1 Tax=Nesterenkonia alba TaxID=515814 RepID=UPI0003B5AFB5|nr:peptidase S10 [Nesterenkonia alba]
MADDAVQPETTTETTSPQSAEPVDEFVTTEHSLSLPDGELKYRAVAGRMVVAEEKLDDGVFQGVKPKAQVFITTYVKTDDAGNPDPSRPVVFAFNGGPGSSSVWLHIGLFGPRRVVVNDVDDRTPPPYGLTDNHETLLKDADLVFIDPMTTGFTRAAEGTKPAEHHGFTGDRDLVGEAIRLWLSKNNRWLSPKFLAGESYGTTRAAALAGYLAQRYGIALNGVMLISAVLDMGTIRFDQGNEQPFIHFLPTYAAIAHYHGKHPGRQLREVVAEATEFAYSDYTLALMKGSRATSEEFSTIAAKYAELTGLDQEYVELNDLRVDAFAFFSELLRRDRLKVGRLDSRFTGPVGHPTGDGLGDDPSYPIIQYPYTAAINHLLGAELQYSNDLVYEIISRRVHPWSYKEFEGRSITTAEDLAFAMRANPDLKVYVGFGFHDSATPFAASEYVLDHLRIPESARENFVRKYYEAGHMMYVHQPSRVEQSEDLAAFVAWSTGSGEKPASNDPASA